jgi:hypothetical protein
MEGNMAATVQSKSAKGMRRAYVNTYRYSVVYVCVGGGERERERERERGEG